MRCAVLNGLTPDGEAMMNGCIQSGGPRCEPPYDWK